METKFTKGEWFLKNRCGGYRIKDNEQRDVCDIYSFASSISDEEAAANAKLIAAAPDLFEACITVEKMYSEVEKMVDGEVLDMINKVRNAIKKATE